MARLSMLITAMLVVVSTFMCAALAQTATATNEAEGILPSGFGDAIDRDVVKIRDVTAKFKTTRPPKRRATSVIPTASNINRTARWVITFRTKPWSIQHSISSIRKCWFMRRCPTAHFS